MYYIDIETILFMSHIQQLNIMVIPNLKFNLLHIQQIQQKLQMWTLQWNHNYLLWFAKWLV